jgi:hypothetical protein
MDEHLRERASGDPSAVQTTGSGRSRWADALRTLRHGGGGEHITPAGLLARMLEDLPRNEQLAALHDEIGVLARSANR